MKRPLLEPSEWRQRHVLVPLIGVSVSLTTLIVCVIITKVNDVWVSGLSWPFFSDMGRDPPAYYVFVVGLTTLAILLAIAWHFNYRFQARVLRDEAHIFSLMSNEPTKRLLLIARIVLVSGIVSTIGLPVLSIFDVSSYVQVHVVGAYWFFAWEALAVFLNTYLSKRIFDLAKSQAETQDENYVAMESSEIKATERSLQRRRVTMLMQISFTALFIIGFIVYIPLGRLLGGDLERLTIDGCIERNLGEDYCRNTVSIDETRTELYKAEPNYTLVRLRAIGQLVSILTLMGYSLSFMFHEYHPLPHSDEEQQRNS